MGKLGKEKGQLKKDKSISHLDHCLEFLKKWNQEYRPDLGSFLKDGTGLILKFILKIKIRDNWGRVWLSTQQSRSGPKKTRIPLLP